MLHWFIRLSEFAEFMELVLHLGSIKCELFQELFSPHKINQIASMNAPILLLYYPLFNE